MNNFSEIAWKNIIFLQIILYPWRLLGVEVFLVSVLAGVILYSLRRTWMKYALAIILIAIAFYGNRNHIQVNGRTNHNDAFYFSFPGTSDMWGEFLPVHAKPPTQLADRVIGTSPLEINDLIVRSNKLSFTVKADKEVEATINTFYYPGWQASIDGKRVMLNNTLLLTFNIPQGTHRVDTVFTETPLREVGDIIALLSVVFLGGLFFYNLIRCKKLFV